MTAEALATPVRDIMSHGVATILADAALEEAARRLVGNRVSGMPVVDAGGVVVGVVTLTDIVENIAGRAEPGGAAGGAGDGETQFYDAADIPRLIEQQLPTGRTTKRVRDVMSVRLITVVDSATVREAAAAMAKHRVHRLLVLDAAGHLVGIVSTLDVVAAVSR